MTDAIKWDCRYLLLACLCAMSTACLDEPCADGGELMCPDGSSWSMDRDDCVCGTTCVASTTCAATSACALRRSDHLDSTGVCVPTSWADTHQRDLVDPLTLTVYGRSSVCSGAVCQLEANAPRLLTVENFNGYDLAVFGDLATQTPSRISTVAFFPIGRTDAQFFLTLDNSGLPASVLISSGVSSRWCQFEVCAMGTFTHNEGDDTQQMNVTNIGFRTSNEEQLRGQLSWNSSSYIVSGAPDVEEFIEALPDIWELSAHVRPTLRLAGREDELSDDEIEYAVEFVEAIGELLNQSIENRGGLFDFFGDLGRGGVSLVLHWTDSFPELRQLLSFAMVTAGATARFGQWELAELLTQLDFSTLAIQDAGDDGDDTDVGVDTGQPATGFDVTGDTPSDLIAEPPEDINVPPRHHDFQPARRSWRYLLAVL